MNTKVKKYNVLIERAIHIYIDIEKWGQSEENEESYEKTEESYEKTEKKLRKSEESYEEKWGKFWWRTKIVMWKSEESCQ